MNGKGDNYRPVDRKKYEQNFDDIDFSSIREKSNLKHEQLHKATKVRKDIRRPV